MISASARDQLGDWLLERGTSLSERQWDRLLGYLDSVAEATRSVNLTADRSPERMLLRHAADGLAAVPLLRRRLAGIPAPRLLDLGAGAGFVGVAIKIAWPEAVVTLMESAYRKFLFLNTEAVRLALPGLRVRWERGAAGALDAAAHDAVLARALAKLPAALETAMPLAAPGGIFVCWTGPEPDPREPGLARALRRSRARFIETAAYRLPGETAERRLAVFAQEGGYEPA